MTTSTYKKPVPNPENPELTKPFWEATKRHELVVQRCKTCSCLMWYPREQCPDCLSPDLEWAKMSGKARVYSFTVIYQARGPAFQEEAPYVYAMIQLDEGPKMISTVVGCKHEDVKVDMPVTVAFDDITPEWTLVKFKPA